ITQVRSGDQELTRITGAQAPSGIPVTIPKPAADRPRTGSPSSSRGRRSRNAQNRRTDRTRRAPGQRQSTPATAA
ncbi:ATP-dependent helicase, partial [Streptomyces sp. NPDC000151]